MLYSHIFMISQYIGQTISPKDKNLTNQILTNRKEFSLSSSEDIFKEYSLSLDYSKRGVR